MSTKVRVLGKDAGMEEAPLFPRTRNPSSRMSPAASQPGAPGDEAIRPILNYYNPTGSTRFVHGQTSRETYPTRHSHVNARGRSTAAGKAAPPKTLDDLAEKGHVRCLGKECLPRLPHPLHRHAGKQRDYSARLHRSCAAWPAVAEANLIVEVTGFDRDKEPKRWTVVESLAARGQPHPQPARLGQVGFSRTRRGPAP